MTGNDLADAAYKVLRMIDAPGVVASAVQFLREIKPLMADNVAMLGAILQRLIMDQVEAGLPLEQAVQEAAGRHTDIILSSNKLPAAQIAS